MCQQTVLLRKYIQFNIGHPDFFFEISEGPIYPCCNKNLLSKSLSGGPFWGATWHIYQLPTIGFLVPKKKCFKKLSMRPVPLSLNLKRINIFECWLKFIIFSVGLIPHVLHDSPSLQNEQWNWRRSFYYCYSLLML